MKDKIFHHGGPGHRAGAIGKPETLLFTFFVKIIRQNKEMRGPLTGTPRSKYCLKTLKAVTNNLEKVNIHSVFLLPKRSQN